MPQTGGLPVLRWQNPNNPIAFPPEFRNGRKIGLNDMSAYRVWGYCSSPGATVSVTGFSAPASTTCNGGRWELLLDFSAEADGDVIITVQQDTDPAVVRRLVKDTASCAALVNETTNAAIDTRFGASSGPHVICNVQQLSRLQSQTGNYSKSFVLGNNLDLSSGYTDSPIGTNSNGFEGSFDGSGFHLSNLTLSMAGTDSVGFFGILNNVLWLAEVKDLGLEGLNIKGNSHVGGLVGKATGAGKNLSNVYVTGSIKGSVSVGGILGGNSSATFLDNTFSTASVWANGNEVGGLIGYIGFPGSLFVSINKSYSAGDVRGNNRVGGLLGSANSGTVISQSYSTATVSGVSMIVGGLAGYGSTTLQDSYFEGSVYAASSGGGLMGYGSSITIERSYFNGRLLVLSDSAGGLSGSSGSGSANIEDSFVTGSVKLVSTNADEDFGGALIGEGGSSFVVQSSTWLESASLPSTCVESGTGTQCISVQTLDAILDRENGTISAWDFTTPVWKIPAEEGALPIFEWQE